MHRFTSQSQILLRFRVASLNLVAVPLMSWIARLFKDNAKTVTPGRKSQWCLVGNIVEERPSGVGGVDIRKGTKHFSPGTKVYAFPAQWGDGYEKVIVVGRHRGSKDFVTMAIKTDWVTNWRAKVVYNPEVLRRLQDGVGRLWRPRNWEGEREVKEYLKCLQDRKRN